jgi:hypothetical protein
MPHRHINATSKLHFTGREVFDERHGRLGGVALFADYIPAGLN